MTKKKDEIRQEHPHKTARRETRWYNYTLTEVFQRLRTSSDGLSLTEVKKRLAQDGANALPEQKKVNLFHIFLNQFRSAFVYILLIAAVISFLLGDIADSSIILLVVIVNVVIGFFQEYKTQSALAALKKIVVKQTLVKRDGHLTEVPTYDLVVGDVIYLSAGSRVPADARIFEAKDLVTDESALTGESIPVQKHTQPLSGELVIGDRKNMLFMGTIITRGTAQAVVTTTGKKTELGKIAEIVSQEDEERTPLQEKLDKFSKHLATLVLLVAAAIFIFGIILKHDIKEMFATAVAVAVAAIPEGLLILVTVILAIGMRRILKKDALVKRLVSAETLGSTSVICADKTGTLTEGKMRVARIVSEKETLDRLRGKKYEQITATGAEEFLLALKIGGLCNDAFVENPGVPLKELKIKGDTTETALLLAALEVGLIKEEMEKDFPRLDEIPFDASRKYMMTLHRFSRRENIIYLKGAPEVVINQLSAYIFERGSGKGEKRHKKLTNNLRKLLQNKIDELSRDGLRVLAVGYKKIPSNLKSFSQNITLKDFVFVAFIGLRDEPRREIIKVLKETRKAGITPVMITGDYKLTAQTIGQELGFPTDDNHIIEGNELARLRESELKEKITNYSIYARVSPQDKLKIVKAWQDRGAIVAMTGDGVNDAPALQHADIGVAPFQATDVAKEAADVILLNNDFSTIVAAVREGRAIYDNIRKVTLLFLSDSFTEVIIVIVSLLLGWPLPVLPSQILWVNLVDDSFPSISMTQEPMEPTIMKEKPLPRFSAILDKKRKFMIGLISVISALAILFTFFYTWRINNNLNYARTISFAVLGTSTLVYVFSLRSLRQPIWRLNFFSNPYLLGGVALSTVLQLSAIYLPPLQKPMETVPLTVKDWLLVLVIDLMILVIIEIVKLLIFKKR